MVIVSVNIDIAINIHIAITPNWPTWIIFLLSNLSEITPPYNEKSNIGGANPTPTNVTAKEEPVKSHPS